MTDGPYCADCHARTAPMRASIRFPEQVERAFIHRGDIIGRHPAMARAEPEPEPPEPAAAPIEDRFLEIAQSLERGMWIEFEEADF